MWFLEQRIFVFEQRGTVGIEPCVKLEAAFVRFLDGEEGGDRNRARAVGLARRSGSNSTARRSKNKGRRNRGVTWRMTALRFNFTAKSRRASNSSFCCWTGRPGFEGQSMLPTLAIHAARNSRRTGGGWLGGGNVSDFGAGQWRQQKHPDNQAGEFKPFVIHSWRD